MTLPVRVSRTAVADLSRIAEWLAKEVDWDFADHYVVRITARFMRLGDFPHRGSARPDLGPGIRTVPFERTYVIGYRVFPDHVRIVAIRHGRSNFGPLA